MICRGSSGQPLAAREGERPRAPRLALRILGVISLGLACAAGSLRAQPQLTISKIVITNTGPQEINHSLIRANIRVKEGDVYARTAIDDDIRNLYATGYFQDIRVTEEYASAGLILHYLLRGRPTVTQILFKGNQKYSTKKLMKKISADFSGAPPPPASTKSVPEFRPKSKMDSMIGKPLDDRKVFFYGQEIKSFYEKHGYPRTEVKYTIQGTNTCTITYDIKEAAKVKIEDVFFEGARAFSQKKLRKVIKTKRRWPGILSIFRSGVLKEDQMEDDKDALAEFYRKNGYIDFELKDVKTLPVAPGRLALVFVLAEGRQYKVGSVGFKGVTLFATNDILKKLKMNVGSTFTPQGLELDVEAIRDFYGDKGYIGPGSAGAIPVAVRKRPNTQTGTMDLLFELEEGEKSYIEKIEIKGNEKTRDRVIRRELAVAPGEVFDMVKVKLSRQRIEGMNLFSKVDTQPEPTEVPNRRNLIVGVEEKSTGQFSIGAGFSSIDSLFGFVDYREENFDLFKPPYFRGDGQKLRLHLQMGLVSQIYNLRFTEPWFLGRKLVLDTDLYHYNLENLSVNELYKERRTGMRVALTRALGMEYLRGTVSYTLEDIGLDNVPSTAPQLIRDEAGSYLASKVGAGLAFDTRRSSFNVFLPDHGQRTEVLSELAGGPFGGETDFYKLETRSSWYFKGLAPKHILQIDGRIGTVSNYGDSDNVHLLDRWFLGGLYNLRGYKYRDVGPKDFDQHEPVGGKTFWFASAEYSIPVIEMLRLAVFYDIGMVYWNAFSFGAPPLTFDGDALIDPGAYNDNWGVGIRLNIPYLGPLRLDYGIPIHSDPFNGSSGRFQFSAGWTREF